MEFAATVPQSANGPTWLLEGRQIKQYPVVIAGAVVSPRSGEVVVRVLNPHNETITMSTSAAGHSH